MARSVSSICVSTSLASAPTAPCSACELGGLLGVPPAGRQLGLGAGALLVRGLLQPAAGVGDHAALLRLLAAAAGEVAGGGLEPPGRGLHPVGLVRVDGVLDGGAAQRPLGDGAGGDGLVVAGLGAVGASPGRRAAAPTAW